MISATRLFHLALAGLASLVLCGCFPPGTTRSDEEKETHYLTGKSRVSGMDYRGAVEAFQKSLEVNPRSAAAHFELGWLYAEKEFDPASAIYHYQKYLELRPNAENAEVIKQHIFRLKQDLAKAVLPLPSTPGVQRELEQLAEENRRLREELERWRNYFASRGMSRSNAVVATEGAARLAAATGGANAGGTPHLNTTPAVATVPRTHKVQPDESAWSIARKYGVSLDAFMAANPGLNPRRMQIGQVVNLPSP